MGVNGRYEIGVIFPRRLAEENLSIEGIAPLSVRITINTFHYITKALSKQIAILMK